MNGPNGWVSAIEREGLALHCACTLRIGRLFVCVEVVVEVVAVAIVIRVFVCVVEHVRADSPCIYE